MEGDAGASRLNPNDTGDSSSSEVQAEDSASEVETEDSASEVKTEDSAESADGTDQTSTEAETEDSADSEELTESVAAAEETEVQDDERIPTRLGRGWFVGIAAALLVFAGGLGAGGYFALRSHDESRAIAQHDVAALEAAKSCVAATQAPDTAAMAASAQKMIDCGTGAFRSQAILYSSLLVEAYQAANAHVQVSDLRAAVERDNPDGSVEVLVPLRVKVSNSEAPNQETGYRLRVTMVSDEGQYRISKLDQVAK